MRGLERPLGKGEVVSSILTGSTTIDLVVIGVWNVPRSAKCRGFVLDPDGTSQRAAARTHASDRSAAAGRPRCPRGQ
jgi:hypothetical protein